MFQRKVALAASPFPENRAFGIRNAGELYLYGLVSSFVAYSHAMFHYSDCRDIEEKEKASNCRFRVFVRPLFVTTSCLSDVISFRSIVERVEACDSLPKSRLYKRDALRDHSRLLR